MKIGAQLFTLYEYTKTLEDFANTLDRVADIGYTTVQVSGTCGYTGEWLAEQLKRTGLKCELTHYSIKEVLADPDAVVEKHNKFNCKYIGLGYYDNIPELCKTLKPAVKRIAELGSKYMYHNHTQEYELYDGEHTYMEMLAEEFTPDELGFTFDTYWGYAAGADLVSEIRRMKGRLDCVHYKDMEVLPNGERRFTWIGNGVIDFERIGAEFEAAGTKYLFVEQDACYGEDPFLNLKKSYDYLRSIGLE